MSYEPTLVILKKDLDKHEKLITNGNWLYDGSDEKTRGGEEGKTVMEYIKEVYEQKPTIVGGLELLVCSPCFSSYNKKIREKLDELNVEYGISN